MLVTQWFCRKCKRILDTAEVRDDKRHVKNDCNGECFVITADDIVENPTQKKFKELLNNIPLETWLRADIINDIQDLKRYRWSRYDEDMIVEKDGKYLEYDNVMNVLKENRDNAKKEK